MCACISKRGQYRDIRSVSLSCMEGVTASSLPVSAEGDSFLHLTKGL